MNKLIQIILLSLFAFSSQAGELTHQEQEECLALAQIAGLIVQLKAAGVAKDEIWGVFEQQGHHPMIKPDIDNLTNVVFDPENSGANAGDLMSYVVKDCKREFLRARNLTD